VVAAAAAAAAAVPAGLPAMALSAPWFLSRRPPPGPGRRAARLSRTATHDAPPVADPRAVLNGATIQAHSIRA